MIGKSLRERWELGRLDADEAVALLKRMLAAHAKPLVEVRQRDARMVACLVAGADKPTLRLCRELGFTMRPGGAGVFGVLGADAARLFPALPEPERAWLEAPSGPRETKVLLVAGGIALLSLEAKDGAVTVTAAP